MVKNTGYKATLANYPFKYADEQAKSHRDERWSDDHYERERREADWNFHKDSFFCDIPSDRYSRVVFTSTDGENLWNLPAIKSMCNVDNLRVSDHIYLDKKNTYFKLSALFFTGSKWLIDRQTLKKAELTLHFQ
ncbi:UNVERIFIED_CONTAM: Protein dispatched 1 [Gekko kuhli]